MTSLLPIGKALVSEFDLGFAQGKRVIMKTGDNDESNG